MTDMQVMYAMSAYVFILLVSIVYVPKLYVAYKRKKQGKQND